MPSERTKVSFGFVLEDFFHLQEVRVCLFHCRNFTLGVKFLRAAVCTLQSYIFVELDPCTMNYSIVLHLPFLLTSPYTALIC